MNRARYIFVVMSMVVLLLSGCVNRSNKSAALGQTEKQQQTMLAQNDSVSTQGKFLLVKPVNGEVSSYYGLRKLGKRSAKRKHHGIDLRARRGAPVFAAAPGTVCYVGRGGRGYGRIIDIQHDNGMRTRYAHLDGYNVSLGAKVEPGTQIGRVGRSGRTTGANLHFELFHGDKRIDPLAYASWDDGKEEVDRQ